MDESGLPLNGVGDLGTDSIAGYEGDSPRLHAHHPGVPEAGQPLEASDVLAQHLLTLGRELETRKQDR